jgi:membrane-bound metal-dependent hydrolase YbcI (DUF457 family)
MPFTPFHMGPALALKAVSGRYFSVLVFGIAQVAMDIEPLYGMTRNAGVLHGWSHSYVGATVIGGFVTLVAPPLCRLILARWNSELEHHGVGWLGSAPGIGWVPATTGAFVGTYSHVALDSIMHSDITPLSPWSMSNGLLGVLSISELHTACVAAGIFGVAAWFSLGLWVRKLKGRHENGTRPG